MKVLLVHGYYQQRSGEAFVYELERDALRADGVEVLELTRDNDEIARYSLARKATLPLRTIWAWDVQRELAALLARERPQLAHFVNTLPLISPAAYRTCQQAGVAVVQTLQNYRLACPAATFVRDGAICEECPEHGLQRSVRYACYRGSRAASAAVASMLAVHRALGTYARDVDAYLAPTEFVRQKLIASAGLPPERVRIKSNFIHPDPGASTLPREPFALFVGRLAEEKGLRTLVRAWRELRDVPLRIVGGGPLEAELRAARLPHVEVVGERPRSEVLAWLRRARLLVFPSEWYEGQPLTLLEALACGTPIVCSDVGSMPEIVRHGEDGLLFRSGDAESLRAAVHECWHDAPRLARFGASARAHFERDYTLAENQRRLRAIYRDVLARRTV